MTLFNGVFRLRATKRSLLVLSFRTSAKSRASSSSASPSSTCEALSSGPTTPLPCADDAPPDAPPATGAAGDDAGGIPLRFFSAGLATEEAKLFSSMLGFKLEKMTGPAAAPASGCPPASSAGACAARAAT